MEDSDIETGPLSSSDLSDLNVSQGLPDKYLGGQSIQFHDLEFEEVSTSEETTVKEAERNEQVKAKLKLDLNAQMEQKEESGSNIIFSPGGSEAYVFNPQTEMDQKLMTQNPSEIRDRIFAERPRTLGQTGDDMAKVPKASDMKFMDMDDMKSVSVESSPRRQEIQSKRPMNYQRKLPKIPRDQFLQDPDSFNPNFSEHDADIDSFSSPGVPSLSLTDRPNSPSVASVVSAASSTASGMLSGRKNLEWDSGADLGYLGDIQNQTELANLSSLEKMAIGNLFQTRSEPEGKSSKDRAIKTKTKTKVDMERRKAKEENIAARYMKFSDSFMLKKERELRESIKNKQRRPKSREKHETPQSSPGHEGSAARYEKNYRSSRIERKQFGSPIKSSSLTDLRNYSASEDIENLKIRSNSDVSQPWLPHSARQFLLSSNQSEPSSFSSSTATVIHSLNKTPSVGLGTGGSDQVEVSEQTSVPSHLQGFFQISSSTQTEESRSKIKSNSSLSSRRSGSRSFETVINMGGARSQAKAKMPPAKGHSHKWSTKANLNTDEEESEDDTTEATRSNYFNPTRRSRDHLRAPITAWSDSGANLKDKKQISRNSSVATTSDEEKDRYRNMSTIESTQLDRAKSFEYFPGESFPMQENSSSYEYLPGHMVTDRPGTVVSMRVSNQDGASTTSSELEANQKQTRKLNIARRKLELEPRLLNTDLQNIAEELNERSKELLQAHVKKTRHFYKKMERYIKFVSTPPTNSDESRSKQDMINKLMRIMNNQQHLLHTSFPKQILDSSEESEINKANAEIDGRNSITIEEETAKITDGKTGKDSDNDNKMLLYKKRIHQMRVLRKEIKKLETLEHQQLKDLMIKTFSDMESLTFSDQSSLVSTSSEIPEFSKEAKNMMVSGVPKTHSLKTSGAPTNVGEVTGARDHKSVKEFGQTYPTPREDMQVISTEGQTNSTYRKSRKSKQKKPEKPIAYYLPISNEGVIKVGRKLLKESNSDEYLHSKENRSILANYMAGLDLEPLESKTSKRYEENHEESVLYDPEHVNLTLKDALELKRPDFVRRAEYRRNFLQDLKEHRLEMTHKKQKWLNHVAELSPRSRSDVQPPNFRPVRVQRLFKHREMVQNTRRKFEELPEYQSKIYENKRKSSFRTNRVMKDLYKKKLQQNVLKGKVSMVHHKNVIEF